MAHATTVHTADGQAVSGRARYLGFSVRETSGSASARIDIYSGTSAAGLLLDSVSLAANESTREWYGPQGFVCPNGIYVDEVSGEVAGVVRYE